ncbi:MAG TPA: PmoA family protein [Blastocatellia bacterium]|nr:PmoA family protein [Blastocatellia bacterium]
MSKRLTFACIALCLSAPYARVVSSRSHALSSRITIFAGKADRRDTIVSFSLPADLAAKAYALVDDSGRVIPLQVDSERVATFILPVLSAGSSKTFTVRELKTAEAGSQVQLSAANNQLIVSASGHKIFAYQTEGQLPSPDIKPIFKRGGYIHPVYTPSGRIVTDDYPPDHFHHHGIWFAWTKTEFKGRHPDFWNMGDGTGRVEFVSVDDSWSGPVHAGFKSRTRYVDVDTDAPVIALNEQWLVRVYNVGQGEKPYAMFDLVSSQNCATSDALILPEYRYGGVGLRGNRQWLSKDNCDFLTSEGKDRNNGHSTRARWCHMGGRIDGQLAGIAVLDHPSNFRSPQPMRINPDQPFFCYAPSQMGQWQISPGTVYVSRYRFVVYDGSPDKSELDRMWEDFANPPQVSVSRK